MKFTYNDMEFSVDKAGKAWDITRGGALVAASLFADDKDGEAKAAALVKTIFPVGIKTVPPDTAHPTMVGDLKIVPPDINHSSFVYWNKDSVSQPKQL